MNLAATIAAAARRRIEDALNANGRNVTRAALELGVNRTWLYKAMRRYMVIVPPKRARGLDMRRWERVQ